MSFLRPENPGKRLILGYALGLLWFASMWVLWAMDAPGIGNIPRSGTNHGWLSPIFTTSGRYHFDTVSFHIDWLAFAKTLLITLILTHYCLWRYVAYMSRQRGSYLGHLFDLLKSSWMSKSERRIRAGHCPTCGYDLRTNFTAGCPECGWHRDL